MMLVADWQALLFVPVGADRHLASAIRHRPDAIILDLEDAIAPREKASARARLVDCQAQVTEAGIDCVVRVNAPLAMMIEDLRALDIGRTAALMLAKVEDRRSLENAAELTGGAVKLIALIETPLAALRLPDIAGHPALAGLMLGSEDFSASLGIDPNGGGLTHLAAQIAMAASAHGLLAIGFPGSIGNFGSLDLYARQIAEGRALGMQAVAAIHPAQLPVIRAALQPTDEEIAWATSVLRTNAESSLAAVTTSGGSMVDAPVIARARLIAQRASRTIVRDT
jgi:citrate lyase subunit beta/citryl-CoA lyase